MSSKLSESLVHRVRRRASWWVRDRFPYRLVERQVQGVDMVLPWSHRLPDYARIAPLYGQNLVELARELGTSGPVAMLDVGANVGDSVLQVLAVTEGAVLAVEADDKYLHFLRRNVESLDNVVIEPSLLVPGDVDDAPVVSVRRGGTAHFAAAESTVAESVRRIGVRELRTRHTAFDDLRLVKSDTDGYDVVLVPAIAEVWADRRPVLFFEYDHTLSRQAGNEPTQVWSQLADLGYGAVAVWDHAGHVVGLEDVSTMAARSVELDAVTDRTELPYWDVAVAHRDDATGTATLERLIRGTRTA